MRRQLLVVMIVVVAGALFALTYFGKFGAKGDEAFDPGEAKVRMGVGQDDQSGQAPSTEALSGQDIPWPQDNASVIGGTMDDNDTTGGVVSSDQAGSEANRSVTLSDQTEPAPTVAEQSQTQVPAQDAATETAQPEKAVEKQEEKAPEAKPEKAEPAAVPKAGALINLASEQDLAVFSMRLATDRPVQRVTYSNFSNPKRLAIDLRGKWKSALKKNKIIPEGNGPITSIRLGRHEDRLRIVLDFRDKDLKDMIKPQIETRGNTVNVKIQ